MAHRQTRRRRYVMVPLVKCMDGPSLRRWSDLGWFRPDLSCGCAAAVKHWCIQRLHQACCCPAFAKIIPFSHAPDPAVEAKDVSRQVLGVQGRPCHPRSFIYTQSYTPSQTLGAVFCSLPIHATALSPSSTHACTHAALKGWHRLMTCSKVNSTLALFHLAWPAPAAACTATEPLPSLSLFSPSLSLHTERTTFSLFPCLLKTNDGT